MRQNSGAPYKITNTMLSTTIMHTRLIQPILPIIFLEATGTLLTTMIYFAGKLTLILYKKLIMNLKFTHALQLP